MFPWDQNFFKVAVISLISLIAECIKANNIYS